MASDFQNIIRWWFTIFVIGIIFLPVTRSFFSRFFDKGYIFSKTIGIIVVSYLIFTLATFRFLPFNLFSILAIFIVLLIFNVLYLKSHKLQIKKRDIYIFFFEEAMFFLSLLFWAHIKSYQPDIHGLEKFMDFGFINSILRSTYFPPTDMWFPPLSINYYYFGHLATAVIIKISNISPFIGFNLMLSSIFAFTITSSFSIVATISKTIFKKTRTAILSGILAGLLTTLGGNLHTIYTLFTPYTPADKPLPFWDLTFNPLGFPNNYWYPNATRFIPFTIHEFPSYSFVVSDLHGHVLDIPFVLLTLAVILTIFLKEKLSIKTSIFISFLLAIMYMTNAWDGIIYFGLFSFTVLLWKSSVLKINIIKGKKNQNSFFKKRIEIQNFLNYITVCAKYFILAIAGYIIFALPFNLHFKPFVSGIGVICAPTFLTNIGKLGPFLFEANHCDRSPLWMLIVLWGFFYFFAIAIIIKILKLKKVQPTLFFILLLILLSTLLIFTPELIYAKDIYPGYYRANTMFKLGYQAFIMLSLVTSFSITYLLHQGRRIVWFFITFIFLVFIFMYPFFAVSSYFNNLTIYKGLNGLSYLQTLYPDDYSAILWIQKNIKGQPVMLEAQGDSYTDYERISANTGLPTPLGWTVHEWLWRGSYSFPESRLNDIKTLYEGTLSQTKVLIKKYNISYVYIGLLEREKYPDLNEKKFEKIGKVIFQKGDTRIYKIN